MNGLWKIKPNIPALGTGIHLWQINLDTILPSHVAACVSLLSPDELIKAQRFRRPIDQIRYTYTRGVLRFLLGAYIHLPPHDIRLVYGTHGKPHLAPQQGTLQFNVSHSAERALAAFCGDVPVGVDVECAREDVAVEQIAARYFSSAERAWLDSLPRADQSHGFFTLWTRKEALLKARGEGLWGEIERTEVLRAPSGWSLIDVDIDALYCATIASPGDARKIKRFYWPLEDETAVV